MCGGDFTELCPPYCTKPHTLDTTKLYAVIISPNKVFGDIMVLASRPPVDPDDVNTLNTTNIQPISFKFYMRVDCFQILYRGEVPEAT